MPAALGWRKDNSASPISSGSGPSTKKIISSNACPLKPLNQSAPVQRKNLVRLRSSMYGFLFKVISMRRWRLIPSNGLS